MSETLRCRRRVFENSAATALIPASMPPMPSPVTTRQMERATSPLAVVGMTMPTAITTRHPRIVGRRPTLSATPPRIIEPTAMPRSSIDSTIPRAARSMPHSCAIPGDAKLIERTSKPSSAFRPTVIATTTIWSGLIAEPATTSRGSLVFILGHDLTRRGYAWGRASSRGDPGMIGPPRPDQSGG